MDFAIFDTSVAEEGVPMEVKHPRTGAVLTQEDGSPITITLLGMDSKVMRRLVLEQQRQTLKARQKGEIPDLDQAQQDAIDLFVAATVKWSGIVLGGITLECTPANARRLYIQSPRLREQIDLFLGNSANFLNDKLAS